VVKVVSVINHKGGVGKTTLTANLGAGLAARGQRVLLVDLDSQASLTVSLIKETEWRDAILPRKTIKHWFDGLGTDAAIRRMSPLISSPRQVIPILAPTGGYLDLIAAHRDLTDTDGELEHLVRADPSTWVTAHHRLQEGLRQPDLGEYDVVLIDCAPHFGPLARNAVLASDMLLVPVRPDSLSTNGLNSLALKVDSAIRELTQRRGDGDPGGRLPMEVVFTMVQTYADQPIDVQRTYISRVRALGVPTLSTYVRESKRVYGPSPEQGIPVILGGTSRALVRELRDLVDELSERLEGISA
jgi:chromosome partitioning protein